MGEILNLVGWNGNASQFSEMRRRFKETLCIDVPENLPGVEPFNVMELNGQLESLFTVGALVTFVERRLAASAA